MNKKLLFLIVFLLVTGVSFADTIKTLNVSKSFASVPGTPRVIRNGFEHVWLVAWRQQGASPKIVGRIVDSDGKLKVAKSLAKGVTQFSGNFDVFYDSTEYKYLLAFETSKGLQVQLFSGSLAKQGSSSLIEDGASNSIPRLAYDPVGKKFLIFWLSTQDGVTHKVLKSRLLDPTGKPAGNENILAKAASGKTFESLSISTDQKNGNLIAIALLQGGDSASLLGFPVKPNATALRKKAVTFQSTSQGLSTTGDASFADAGTGFGFWFDRGAIKFRKMSSKLKFSSTAKSIANAGDDNSRITSMLFDSRNNQFIGAWGVANQIKSVVLSPSGAIVKDPFVVTEDTGVGFQNVATSYDAQLGNAIVVWDETSGSQSAVKIKERAAIFTVGGSGSTSGISIGDNFFSPNNISVQAGATVTWTSNGNNQHTVTSGNGTPDGLFDSGTLNHGQTFSFRFMSAGTYHYYCQIHGATAMSGTITVNDGGEPGPHY
jgi:plastocyanin